MARQKTGRPYVEGITEALMAAAEDVLANGGYAALTVDGLASAVGTTRPTFYRRFPSVAHIAFAVIKSRFATRSDIDSGSIFEDILTLQREEVAMFSDPVMRNSLLGLLQAAAEDAQLRQAYQLEFIAPRRENVARVLQSALGRGELLMNPQPKDVDFVCELLLGPILARVLLPIGAPLDESLARATTHAALRALGFGADASSASPKHGSLLAL